MKTPAHLKGEVRKESAAFAIGTAVHTLILEPSKEATIICGGADRRGNQWKDAKAKADSKGGTLLTQYEYDQVFRMRDAALANKDIVAALGKKGKSEVSLFADDKPTGIKCKIRPDRINETDNIMVDLKTCVSASPEAFSRAVNDYGYHIQAAFYRRIWEGHVGDLNGFLFVAIEKNEPYLTAIYELDKLTMMEGYNQVNLAMAKYRQCSAANNWYGYPSGIQQIRIPSYGFKTVDAGSFPMMQATQESVTVEEDWS
jgi:hypothetical protein